MEWLFIGLFIVGSFFYLSARGADDPRQKRIFRILMWATWVAMLILGNVLLR